MAAPSKERLIFGIFLLVLIVVIELTLHYFHLPTWPAFLMILGILVIGKIMAAMLHKA